MTLPPSERAYPARPWSTTRVLHHHSLTVNQIRPRWSTAYRRTRTPMSRDRARAKVARTPCSRGQTTSVRAAAAALRALTLIAARGTTPASSGPSTTRPTATRSPHAPAAIQALRYEPVMAGHRLFDRTTSIEWHKGRWLSKGAFVDV